MNSLTTYYNQFGVFEFKKMPQVQQEIADVIALKNQKGLEEALNIKNFLMRPDIIELTQGEDPPKLIPSNEVRGYSLLFSLESVTHTAFSIINAEAFSLFSSGQEITEDGLSSEKKIWEKLGPPTYRLLNKDFSKFFETPRKIKEICTKIHDANAFLNCLKAEAGTLPNVHDGEGILEYLEKKINEKADLLEPRKSAVKTPSKEEVQTCQNLQAELLAEEAEKQAKKSASRKKTANPSPEQPKTSPKEKPPAANTQKEKPRLTLHQTLSVLSVQQHDRHFEQRPGVQFIPIPSHEDQIKYVKGPIHVMPHVQRWKEIQSLDEISSFPDLRKDGKALRYAHMNENQLQEQLCRHDSSGLERLLSSKEFIKKYARQTRDGYAMKVRLEFPGSPPSDTWVSATFALDSEGHLSHFFCHKEEELTSSFDENETPPNESFSSVCSPKTPPLLTEKRGKETFEMNASSVISIKRTHAIGLKSTLFIAPFQD